MYNINNSHQENSLVFYEEYDSEYNNGLPIGDVIDEYGRLLKPSDEIIDDQYDPEDLKVAVSKWLSQSLSSKVDWQWTSKVVWPEYDRIVMLKRLDIYESDSPKLQQATTNLVTSRKIRNTLGWIPVKSIFFLEEPNELTFELFIDSTGPPKRNKYHPSNKTNNRDFSKWVFQEKVYSFITADRIPGAVSFYGDYCDLPDRYFLSTSNAPPLGTRRLFNFAGYAATQYFILEKLVYSEQLEAEGGFGLTYIIEKGPILHVLHGWRLIGSFYGFDEKLQGSSKYTIYRRSDPFQRMLIQLDNIARAEEWDTSLSFYAFDIPVPQTICYTLQHCLLSIYSAAASIQRHRLTNEYPRNPWEFRMNIYVFPADLPDCTLT